MDQEYREDTFLDWSPEVANCLTAGMLQNQSLPPWPLSGSPGMTKIERVARNALDPKSGRFQNKQIRSRLHAPMSNQTPETKPEQGSNQKAQPVAVCTRCGALSYSLEMINGQCSQVTAGKRCTGVIGSGANKADWEACPACLATGSRDEKPCGQCDGAGWLYIPNRKR